MAAEIITREDLQDFKAELLIEFKKLLSERQQVSGSKWLKGKHVRKLLGISPGTLQNLRTNGSLPFSRIGGAIYYDADDIERMFNERKQGLKLANKKRLTK